MYFKELYGIFYAVVKRILVRFCGGHLLLASIYYLQVAPLYFFFKKFVQILSQYTFQ